MSFAAICEMFKKNQKSPVVLARVAHFSETYGETIEFVLDSIKKEIEKNEKAAFSNVFNMAQ